MSDPVPVALRVLIAPDCFGDSLSAVAAAEAMAHGWRRGRPADALVLAPQSDGGPGFIDVLRAGQPALQVRQARVSGPLTEDVGAAWAFHPGQRVAYIECAQACGLHLLGGPPTTQTAWDAHSRGVGQLIAAALAAGAGTVIVGLGGSGCTDGGRGMIEALGGVATARHALAGVHLVAATDVEHVLLGERGAARVFGPQKGADPATVARLETRLAHWSVELETATGRSVAAYPGAGAAGGLGAALLALGGRRESGAELIAAHTPTLAALEDADLLLTGEGRLDEASLHGKVVGSLAVAAARRGVAVTVLAGQVELTPEQWSAAGITEVHALSDFAGSVQRAIDDAAAQLSGLAFHTARALTWE